MANKQIKEEESATTRSLRLAVKPSDDAEDSVSPITARRIMFGNDMSDYQIVNTNRRQKCRKEESSINHREMQQRKEERDKDNQEMQHREKERDKEQAQNKDTKEEAQKHSSKTAESVTKRTKIPSSDADVKVQNQNVPCRVTGVDAKVQEPNDTTLIYSREIVDVEQQSVTTNGSQPVVVHNNQSNRPRKVKTKYAHQTRIDRLIYSKRGSLQRVPYGACCCRICKDRSKNTRSITVTHDENGNSRLTTAGLSAICRRAAKQIHHQRMSEKRNRIQSFVKTTFVNDLWPDKKHLAEAGFFTDGESIFCFWCSLEFRTMNSLCDPFREHARWCPCCPYVRCIQGDEYIHEIMQDTMEISDAYYDMKDTMDPIVMQEVLKYYHPEDIESTILVFFEKYGGYPSFLRLSEILETRNRRV